MNADEFTAFKREIDEKESILDGKCTNLCRFGGFSKHLMKKSGLIGYVGCKGKTRIVIEYNNDTGEGWMRAVSEDPVTQAIQKYQSEHPQEVHDHPTDYC